METTENVLHQHSENHGDSWEGAASPFNISYGKLMMWYFLLSDAFTFAGFLIAYGALRFSSPSWPVPDFVFSTAPFGIHDAPLIFVTIMSFLLIISSVTMVRAVQEGHRENKKAVVFWMFLTIIGGAGFLGCQAWEWTNLIGKENMSVTTNPFGSHIDSGVYLDEKGKASAESFKAGASYLLHKSEEGGHDGAHAEGHHILSKGDHSNAFVDKDGFIHRKFKVTSGPNSGEVATEEFGPKAFGALFFFITGFHGFHVLSGVAFLTIIMINVASGVYAARKNGYEMVEKIGLYWHFVDLVWVFVFLVFYLF